MNQSSGKAKPLSAILVDKEVGKRRQLAALLEATGLRVQAFTGVEQAISRLNPQAPPDLIVTGLFMPGLDGWHLCRLMRSTEYKPFNQVPILVVSATYHSHEAERLSADLGANAFLGYPVAEPLFKDTVGKLLAAEPRPTSLSHVLIIEDDEATACLLERTFSERGYQTEVALNAGEGEEKFYASNPEIVIIDYILPDRPGHLLLRKFRRHSADSVCIMISGDSRPELVLEWMRLGAAAYAHKPFRPEYLVHLCEQAARERALLRIPALLRERTQALRRNQERYQGLFDNMLSGVALYKTVFDTKTKEPLDYRLIEYNPALEKTTGMKADSLRGQTFRQAMPASEHRLLDIFRSVTESGRPAHQEYFSQAFQRYFEATVYIPEPNHLALVLRDITEQKQQEQKIRRLAEMQRLIMLLAQDFINVPIKQIDAMFDRSLAEFGTFAQVDRAYIFHYDFKLETMTNIHEWCAPSIAPQMDNLQNLPLSIVPDQVAAHRDSAIYHIPRTDNLPENKPLRTILEAGDIKTLMTVPMMLGDQCIGFVGFDAVRQLRVWNEEEVDLLTLLASLMANAESRRRAEQERMRSEQQTQQTQRLESLGVLAGGIAHDFNNILMAILGNAEMIKEDSLPPSDTRKSMEVIISSCYRAADLCRQMLAYAGQGTFTVEPTDLSMMIRDIRSLLESAVSKKSTLSLHLPQAPSMVMADPSQIQQVAMNLVINASEAIGDHEGTIHLRLENVYCDDEYLRQTEMSNLLPAGSYLRLEVADNGCGIDPATRQRMFEPFFTTKFTGRGLGLAVVAGIVRAHQGALKVYSELGRGTSIQVFLPALGVDDVGERPAPYQTRNRDAWRGEGTILLAEDDESVRLLSRHILERLGFQVLIAADGLEAVDIYRQKASQIDLVLLDLTMPRLDGRQAFDEMRKINPQVQAIVASGYNKENVAERFARQGLAGFIQKPYSTRKLEGLLKDFFAPATTPRR